MLYSFLASIRQSDGQVLMDSKGRTTSHLKGLFNRCVYFKKNNIKPIFVFDGKAHALKERTRELRREKKIEAGEKYQEALDLGLAQDARKYAQQLGRLDDAMIEQAKKVMALFGFAVVQAPSEGEAQAAQLVLEGKAFAVASQDFDSLLFGAPFVIRNLSVSTKRKIAGTSIYKEVPIEYYDVKKSLDSLTISKDDLIILSMLCGTDFNPSGIHGIGPKKALKLVKEYKDRWDELFKAVDWYSAFPYSWQEVFAIFNKPNVEKNMDVVFGDLNKDELVKYLSEFDFGKEQVEKQLKDLQKEKGLTAFF
jgi:flap endonuclease-1